MEAKKFLKKTESKNRIIIEYEKIDIPLTKEDIMEICSVYGDDYESAYFSYGIAFDWADDIVDINIDRFLEQVKDDIEQDEESVSDIIKNIVKKLDKSELKGFSISPD